MNSSRDIFERERRQVAASGALGRVSNRWTAGVLCLGVIFGVLQACSAAAGGAGATVMWYDRPAANWFAALPIGSGRLGAMVFGATENERIQFNEQTLWSGGPHDYNNPEAIKHLGEARRLIFAGKNKQADDLLHKMMGTPARQQAYQPLGDLKLHFPGHGQATGYRRSLDLARAVASVSYKLDGVRYAREAFASYPAQVIAVRLTADKPGRISFDLSLTSKQPGATVRADGDKAIVLSGRLGKRTKPSGIGSGKWTGDWNGKGLAFEARAAVGVDGGSVAAGGGGLKVRGANSATILLAAATSFKTYRDITGDPSARVAKVLTAAAGKPYGKLLAAHVADHSRLQGRVKLDLPPGPASGKPTDQRIKGFEPGADEQLAALLFQYGRYLLIASSRPGGQPANLQGIWNDDLWPPWSSKWTININTQMNYWPAEVCNLSECHQPLLDLVTGLAESGRRTARAHYGARGWVCHHNADIWLGTAPVDLPFYGMWPTGGAWLSLHMWEHYLFTGNKEFLKKRAYPVLKSAAEFFLDTLVEEPAGKYLVTCPSMSPEHGPSGRTSICAGPSMDSSILRDLFDACIRSSKILGVDEPFGAKLAAARKRLAPLKVGKSGQLQEWLEDLDNPKDTHGHVSHLYALYPSQQITRDTPGLQAAARTTLRQRGIKSGGWPGAWRINLLARLGDGQAAHTVLNHYIARSVLPNGFNGGRLFQIDANFGVTAAVAEMLLQSRILPDRTGEVVEIHLLPALPKAWRAGRVTGLRARGGFEVDIAWSGGRLTAATVRSELGRPCTLRGAGKRVNLKTDPGKTYRLDAALQR
ncbi:MAG: glycoside hydrolase family 95 protein [Phycisphaerae bacterium]|nr:glycoside hydrolase family 95 protein [Phycisphaerae bacterium]